MMNDKEIKELKEEIQKIKQMCKNCKNYKPKNNGEILHDDLIKRITKVNEYE